MLVLQLYLFLFHSSTHPSGSMRTSRYSSASSSQSYPSRFAGYPQQLLFKFALMPEATFRNKRCNICIQPCLPNPRNSKKSLAATAFSIRNHQVSASKLLPFSISLSISPKLAPCTKPSSSLTLFGCLSLSLFESKQRLCAARAWQSFLVFWFTSH